ncbi:MAG TPA: pyridoxamine 5'-phosphate oxidase family protein [Pseudonocardia sp.]|nr:pyridoxamine 5'-phosphate oxidase family protein [Pseudonocardia sp.]
MDRQLTTFLERHPDAAMITLRADGSAHMARVEVALLDGRLCGTGAPELLRTRHLRRDPRCSLFVFGPHPHWVGLETKVTIVEGPDVPPRLARLMQARHGAAAPPGMVLGHDEAVGHDRLFGFDEYAEYVRGQGRLLYEFDLQRAYGNYREDT